MEYPKIRVENGVVMSISFVYPPIPYRNFDYQACVDGQEEDGIYGYGKTEDEAVQHLLETLEET